MFWTPLFPTSCPKSSWTTTTPAWLTCRILSRLTTPTLSHPQLKGALFVESERPPPPCVDALPRNRWRRNCTQKCCRNKQELLNEPDTPAGCVSFGKKVRFDVACKSGLVAPTSAPTLSILTMKKPSGALSAVDGPEWLEIEMTVDSGACDTVMPPALAPHISFIGHRFLESRLRVRGRERCWFA